MSGGASVRDIRILEASLARLTLRLEAAEERIAELERLQGRESSSHSGYSVVTAPRRTSPTSQTAPPPAQEYPLQASAQSSSAPGPRLNDRERQELADQLGDWIRRELEGRGGGVSGRDRLELRSRLYVIAQDWQGNRFNPVRVYARLSELRNHFRTRQDPDASVFLGFATAWEARRAVARARLDWPDAERRER